MTRTEKTVTEEAVAIFDASKDVFKGVLSEMRELSKRKPDTTLSQSKVRILNRILADIEVILKDEPEGKYLELLDEDDLPQNSDAVLVMVQFEKALNAFKGRYARGSGNALVWKTEENLEEWTELASLPGFY